MSALAYRISGQAGHWMLKPFVRLQVWKTPGAVEPAGGAVLVSNHISHFDPFFLTPVLQRRIDWMTTSEFYSIPVIGSWLRAVDTFPVDRSRPDRRSLRDGVARLQAGRLVGVFPEGGIRAGATSILGGAPPRRGATALARLAGVPLLPCLVLGSDRLYATRSWLPGPPRVPVWVAIGAPFSVAELDSDEADERLAMVLRELAATAGRHFALQPDDWPLTPQERRGQPSRATES